MKKYLPDTPLFSKATLNLMMMMMMMMMNFYFIASLGQCKLIIRFSFPSASKNLTKPEILRLKIFSVRLMLKTSFITLLRIADELFVMKKVLKQGFLLFCI